MSLGSAWSVGLSGLATASDQMALVSRNVSRAGDPDAVRKAGEQVTTQTGTVRLAAVVRVSDPDLLDGALSTKSDYSGESVTSSALDRLHATVLGPDSEFSAAALIARLEADLRLYANDPVSRSAGLQAVGSANYLANSLNTASSEIASVRAEADNAIAQSVMAVNTSLRELQTVNAEINSALAHDDVTDQLDRRDAILKSIAEHISIRVVPRGASDIAVYTDGGVVLFETVAREVTFTASGVLGPGVNGFSVRIDGIEVTGSGAVMPLKSGSIAAQANIRDSIAPILQSQVDEIARGLIEAFADPDRTASGQPDIPGLFTWSGATVPASGAVVSGLAAQLRVNPQIDPAVGGQLNYLRDGGASAPANPAYNANPTGADGFSGRLRELLGNLAAVRSFDAASNLGTAVNLKDFAAQSVGWLNGLRQSSATELEIRSAVSARASESLLSVTGVNLDQEMADLLKFEQSYRAATRLIATVDEMIKGIVEATR